MRDSYSLAELAARLGGTITGDPELPIRGVCALDELQPGCIAFTHQHSPQALAKLLGQEPAPQALIIPSDLTPPKGSRCSTITVRDPQRAMMQLARLFYPPSAEPGTVSERADIHPSARLGRNVRIGAFSSIGAEVVIEDDAAIYPNVTIYRGARIGRGAVLHAGAVVREGCTVAAGSVVQNGAIIGADGFGYLPNPDGSFEYVPQVGTVVLEEQVEVGANSCIDRATLGTTRIGAGTKIDNQVQIGHNAKIGKHCILCGQTGLAGSTRIGDHVVLGARTGVADHASIPGGSRFAAATNVWGDIDAPGDYAGSPAMPLGAFRRQLNVLRNLATIIRDLKQSVKKLHEKND